MSIGVIVNLVTPPVVILTIFAPLLNIPVSVSPVKVYEGFVLDPRGNDKGFVTFIGIDDVKIVNVLVEIESDTIRETLIEFI